MVAEVKPRLTRWFASAVKVSSACLPARFRATVVPVPVRLSTPVARVDSVAVNEPVTVLETGCTTIW